MLINLVAYIIIGVLLAWAHYNLMVLSGRRRRPKYKTPAEMQEIIAHSGGNGGTLL